MECFRQMIRGGDVHDVGQHGAQRTRVAPGSTGPSLPSRMAPHRSAPLPLVRIPAGLMGGHNNNNEIIMRMTGSRQPASFPLLPLHLTHTHTHLIQPRLSPFRLKGQPRKVIIIAYGLIMRLKRKPKKFHHNIRLKEQFRKIYHNPRIKREVQESQN